MLTLFVAALGSVAAWRLLLAARKLESGDAARRLAAPRRWRLPAGLRSRLARALEDAGLSLEPEGACELWIATALGATVVAAALSPVLALLAFVGTVAGGPVALHLARDRARRRLVAGLPSALEQIAAGLRGGASVNEAISALADAGGPLAADLGRVRARATFGPGLSGALATWSMERDVVGVRATCGALAVAADVGGPAAAAIDGLGSSLRDRLGAVAEARALSAQARVSAIVVGAAPIVYLAFSALVDPKSLGLLIETGTGRVCFALGIGFEVIGVLVMRKIVRGVDVE